jgi:hypothetical protein
MKGSGCGCFGRGGRHDGSRHMQRVLVAEHSSISRAKGSDKNYSGASGHGRASKMKDVEVALGGEWQLDNSARGRSHAAHGCKGPGPTVATKSGSDHQIDRCCGAINTRLSCHTVIERASV